MLKWQFQIMREPKCSCLQLNPQMEGFSEAEHASVHFTALKEMQHIFFFIGLVQHKLRYRVAVQAVKKTSEPEVSQQSKTNPKCCLIEFFFNYYFFRMSGFLFLTWLPLIIAIAFDSTPSSFLSSRRNGRNRGPVICCRHYWCEWWRRRVTSSHFLRLKSWLIACEGALSWNDIRLRSCWQTALKHKNKVDKETRVSTDKKLK